MKTVRPSIRPLFGIVLLLLASPSLVEAQIYFTNNHCTGAITITTNDGTITITRANVVCGGADPMIIPSTINGLPVTAIGSGAFQWDDYMISVTIPNSVTSIGDGAFRGCSNLGSISIPNSVTNIGAAPFESCSRLGAITVDVLNSFYTSADRVLFNKSQTTLLEYPKGKFGGYAIPNSVTNIGEDAFGGCASLTNIAIPDSVTSIGDYAFAATGLITVTIPNSVTSIGNATFFNCTSLTSIAIPDSVTAIGDNAFQDCTSLTSVMIGNGVTNIGAEAFGGCTGLTAITVDVLNLFYTSADGVLFDKSQTTLVAYPGGKFGAYTIPNTITTIGASAFAGCASLTNVAIPNSVTSIGDGAFSYCTSLSSVTIPNSVTSIGDRAFEKCTSLTNVTIPDSVTSIGAGAFEGTDLINVTIPDSVTSIGYLAFFAVTSLTRVTIGNGVTTIPLGAFEGTGLINVTMGNSVTNIADGAFSECYGLARVYFQGNAPSAVATAFSGQRATATVYYLPGTTGWGSTFGGIPTALWVLPSPVILNHGPSFGAQTNGFGFTISWATNASVVVEASTDLNNPRWSPVQTNVLNGGTFYFSEPEWTNYLSRFYRVRSQ